MIMQDYHGVKLGWKSDYVTCERSLMILLNGLKFMNQSFISPSGRESLFERAERNIFLNISVMILMLTLRSIKMRETAINSLNIFIFSQLHLNISIPPTSKLETNFTKSLKRRDYQFHPRLTWRKISVHSMQHCVLQTSFSWKNFAVMRMVRYMIVLLVSTSALEVLLKLNPKYTSV